MISEGTKLIVYFVLFLFCAGLAEGKCQDGMLDCCGNCYHPGLEDCIKLGGGVCKIVKNPASDIQLSNTQNKNAEAENIYDLINEGKIEVKTEGAGISKLSLKIKPKVDFNIKVSIPPGTFFPAKRGSSQNMVSTRAVTVELEVKPGLEVTVEREDQPAGEHWTEVNVPVACTNMHKAIPGSSDTFEIERSPNQEELDKLLPVLDAENSAYPVMQAAIWIITDDATYDDLGTLVSKLPDGSKDGARLINEYEASEAMKLIEMAGIDIQSKAIWADRDRIREGNKGKPTVYDEGTLHPGEIPGPCGPCPEGSNGPDENCSCWTCESKCPEGWQGPNEKCECWRWEPVNSN